MMKPVFPLDRDNKPLDLNLVSDSLSACGTTLK
jgi:hypothetical protein